MNRWARRLGAATQGTVLGVLLAYAILKLISLASNARIFNYQGF